jgi:hypothetical protein
MQVRVRSCPVVIVCGVVASVSIGCSPEHEVLAPLVDAASDASDAGVDAGCTPGVDCQGLALGSTCAADSECDKGLVCQGHACAACTPSITGCQVGCGPTLVPVAQDRNGCTVCSCTAPATCALDSSCKLGELCLGAKCYPCDQVDDGCAAACPAGQSRYPTKRNGCPVCECAPPNQCATDADCGPSGVTCLAGVSCDDGCDGSPSCCHGNMCAPAGCPPLTKTPCSFAGCPSGLRCHTTCSAVGCKCDPSSATWMCTPCTGDVCSTDP